MSKSHSRSVEKNNICGARMVSQFVTHSEPVSPDSVFADQIWLMGKTVTLPGIPSYAKSWDFGSCPGYPGGFALGMAEYAFARRLRPIAKFEEHAAWLTVGNELHVLREFFLFCAGRGYSSASELNSGIYNRYVLHLKVLAGDDESKTERINYKISIIYRFWDHRERLSEPPTSLPFGKPIAKILLRVVDSDHEGENRTPPIPESVYSAYMTASLDYVLSYGTTIIKAWEALRCQWLKIEKTTSISPPGRRDRALSAAARKILAANPANWRKRPWVRARDLYSEIQQLRVACNNVIIAYSGMRTSEFLSIKFNCCVKDTAEDGSIVNFMNTILHKHREKGKKDTWVVIDEVVNAVDMLTVLTARVRLESGCDLLNLTDSTNWMFCVHKDFHDTKLKEFGQSTIIFQMGAFAKYCNTYLNHPQIPQFLNANGELADWSFNPRQFRRTLARYIARQPFGIIAGMIQYKHVCARMFEGYAGNDPDWIKLLEEERVLAEVDILEEVAIDLSNGTIAGGFGSALSEEFDQEFRGRAEDHSISQIVKWLSGSSKVFYTGKFNFCAFDESKALCISNKEDRSSPILNSCDPTKCENACVSKRHLPLWRAQLKQAENMFDHPKTNSFQRTAMIRELHDLRTVILNSEKQ